MSSPAAGPPNAVVAKPSSKFASLLEALGLPIEADPSEDVFVLCEEAGALDLRPPGEAGRPGIRARFPPGRGQPGGGRRAPLVRAFGKRIERIFDLTAGLGADAFRLAAAGYVVDGFERAPTIFALLESGWQRACETGAVSSECRRRLRFEHAEGAAALARITEPDVGVYLDPMYPAPRRSSALPKRELQVLRQLLGADDSAAELLASARSRAARVVVKRPHHASPLAAGASFVLESKLVRFDVYLNPAKMGASES